MRLWATILLLACCLGAAGVRAETGGTTVAVDGANVTITVNVALCCTENAADEVVWEPLIQEEVKAAENMWNQALAKLPGKGCYNVKVVFDVRLLTKDQRWDQSHHSIYIDFSRPGVPISYDPGTTSPNEDTDTVYNQGVKGEFYESVMSIGTWAHEIGHLMGLGDDYYHEHGLGRAGACLPGRGDPMTLMCGSQNGIIDQNLSDRLADILNIHGRMPACWTGTVHSDTTGNHGSGAVCSGEGWDHQVQFIVGADNQVKGTAMSRRVAMPSCTGPGTWALAILGHEATMARFNVIGQLHGLDFELRFSETFIDGGTGGLLNYSLGLASSGPTLTVPLKTFETANGVVDTNVPIPRRSDSYAIGHHSFDLKCASCTRTPRPM